MKADENKKTNRVSVVIPSYNRAHLLPRAIDSVMRQTFKDFEVVIVDDGSTDNTKDIVRRYCEKYPGMIRYIYQENKGAAGAYNTGVRNASGEYIAFLDSDDEWFEDKLQRQVDILDETGAGMVHTARYETYSDNSHPEVIMPFIPAKNSSDYVSGKAEMSMTILVKKEAALRSGLFDESFCMAEDGEFWYRVAKITELVYIDRPLMRVYKHGGNLQFSDNERMYTDHMKFFLSAMKDKHPFVEKRRWRFKYLKAKYLLALEKYKKRKYRECVKLILSCVMCNVLIGSVGIEESDTPKDRSYKLRHPYRLLIKSVLKI